MADDDYGMTIMDPLDGAAQRAVARTEAAITVHAANELFMGCVDTADIVAVYESLLARAVLGDVPAIKEWNNRVLGRKPVDVNVTTLNINDMIKMAMDAGVEDD